MCNTGLTWSRAKAFWGLAPAVKLLAATDSPAVPEKAARAPMTFRAPGSALLKDWVNTRGVHSLLWLK